MKTAIKAAAQPVSMSTAEATVAALAENGIDTVFGLPGLQSDPLFDAIYRSPAAMKIIHPRHEQACGYMALGAALSTGRPQVASVVPGPGVANISAAMLTAEAMCAPVLTVAGQIPQADIGRGHGHLHEMRDQLRFAAGVNKFAERIDAPGQAPLSINRAFQAMLSGKPGPAYVECGFDTWATKAEMIPPSKAEKIVSASIDEDAVREAAKLVVSAKLPMIVVGGGALDASKEVTALAELTGALVLSYRRGRGVVSTDHPLAINMPIGHKLWPKVDLVIGIGTRLFVQEKQWGLDKDIKVVRIDLDPDAASRHRPADVSMVGNAKTYTAALVNELAVRAHKKADWAAELRPATAWFDEKLSKLQPQKAFLEAIRRALPDDGIFVDEVTQVGFASRLAFPVRKPRTFLSAGFQDNLGWGYGTALGAQSANLQTPVVSIAGDGGFMYQVGELATAVLHKLPVVVIVFDNLMFGNVKRIEREFFNSRHVACELASPNFVELANSFGVAGMKASTPDDLEARLTEALKLRVPALIHVTTGEFPSIWDMILMPRVRGL